MNLRRWLVIALMLLPLPALAQGDAQIYTIKKGDTLWGISQKFLKDPYYWPSLWANNDYVTNPHFIYPGQKVAIYDGRIEILPAEAPVPAAEPEQAKPVPVPAPEPAITIKVPGLFNEFISKGELQSSGTLVDTVDNRLLLAKGDRVFLQLNRLDQARPADRYALFETGKTVNHPVTGELIGYQIIPLGELEITAITPSVAEGIILLSSREIQRGAFLKPKVPLGTEIEIKRASRQVQGYLVSAKENQISLGQYDFVHIDLGAQDGLQKGNLLYISRPRQATERALHRDLELPDVLLGSAIVVDAQAKTALALILKSNGPIYRGDRVTTAMN